MVHEPEHHQDDDSCVEFPDEWTSREGSSRDQDEDSKSFSGSELDAREVGFRMLLREPGREKTDDLQGSR